VGFLHSELVDDIPNVLACSDTAGASDIQHLHIAQLGMFIGKICTLLCLSQSYQLLLKTWGRFAALTFLVGAWAYVPQSAVEACFHVVSRPFVVPA
jgi:hypothetical protein